MLLGSRVLVVGVGPAGSGSGPHAVPERHRVQGSTREPYIAAPR